MRKLVVVLYVLLGIPFAVISCHGPSSEDTQLQRTATQSVSTAIETPLENAISILPPPPTHVEPTGKSLGVVRPADGGILVEDGMGAVGFVVNNTWGRRQADQSIFVQAGVYMLDQQPVPTSTDPYYDRVPYGAVRVWESTAGDTAVKATDYATPIPAGGLAIVDVVDGYFYLRTGLGDDLVFDLASRKYVEWGVGNDVKLSIDKGLVEVQIPHLPEVDGYEPYARWQVQDLTPPLTITAYRSRAIFESAYLTLESEGSSKAVTLILEGPDYHALRAVRKIGNEYLVLFQYAAHPVVVDLDEQRLLGESEASSVAASIVERYDWP